MKKKVFSLMMMLLLAVTGFVRADELTVHDGTITNAYVPVYGFYADAYLKCEMVYPASELSAMNGGQINSLTFGISSPATEAWTGTFEVFVKEVSDATISDFSGTTGATTVYTGTLDGTGSTMTVNFTAPYTYNGGNLLVGFYETSKGNYKSITWIGETVSGASVQGYSYSDLSAVTGSQRDFLPKTTFDYTLGGGQGGEEVVVEIGDGTGTTYYFPIDNYFNYSCTEQIYTAEEIGNAGTINAISFYYNYGTAYTANNVTMYMKHVSRSEFASTSDCEALALDDIVWTGAIAPTEAGWYTFTLDTPFEYNGTDNLLVAFFDGTTGYPGTSYTWRQTTSPNSANMALRYYSDSSIPDPYNLASYTGSKSTYTYRANIQIDITTGGAASGDITVHDGEATNNLVPVYGYYADAYLKCEMVYPAAELSEMTGAYINSMTFYASQDNVSWGDAEFQIFLTEVADASISSFAGPGTIVYEGVLSINATRDGRTVVNFTTPYQYNGGNLLVGVYQTTDEGEYVTSSWLGETVNGASVQGYSYSSLDDITPTQRNFLPKTTFSYGPGPEYIPIDIVEINDFETPVWGQQVTQNVTIPEDANYSLLVAAWFSYPHGMLPPAREMNPDPIYNLSDSDYVWGFNLVPNEGYAFSPAVQAYINGSADNVLLAIIVTPDMAQEFPEFPAGSVVIYTYAYYTYEEGLHTLSTYGVGDNAYESVDRLLIERPNGAWMEPYHFQLYNDGEEDVEVVLIDFLHNNGYFSMAEGTEYPFTVAATGRPGVDLYINTNTDWTDTEELNSLLAVNTSERSTHLYQIVAAPYQPYCPDVVETAYTIDNITAGTEWSMWTSEMWEEENPNIPYELHDNYTLPFPEIPEGYDAVMTFTLDHDMMLNAYVSDGECDGDELNGKVVLYPADFNGQAGPMANNYYDGRPFHNGGGSTPGAYTSIDFETGNFSQFSNYTNDGTYPWYVAAEANHGGTYGMMSGNAGVASSASTFTATVNYTADGTVSFEYNARGEGSSTAWDKCIFKIDGVQQFSYGAVNDWNSFNANVAAGQHTFTWVYQKDSSVNPTGDCFMVDNIVFNGGRLIARTPRGNRATAVNHPELAQTLGGSRNTNMTNWHGMGRGSDAYGICVYNNGGILDEGVNYFDIENIAGASVINSYDGVGGMVCNPTNGHFYVSDYDNSQLYELDADGTLLNTVETDYQILSLAWDATTSTLYSLDSYGWLNITDPATGDMTDIDQIDTDDIVCITANAAGQIYGLVLDSPATLVTISKTDATTTVVGELGANSAYAQSMAFDLNTNELYWAQCYSQDDMHLYKVNLSTLALETIANNPGEICGLCIPASTTPAPGPDPVDPTEHAYTAGPVIEGLNVLAGTYYLVASSTCEDFEVTIGFEELPCPIEPVTGIYPADNAYDIPKTDLTLRWTLNDYCNEWRIIFSSTYWPEDGTLTDPDHPYTYVSEWSSDLAESLTITDYITLWNNTNYFWRIEQRSNAGTEWECYTPGPVFGFTTSLNAPTELQASSTRIFEYEENVTLSWTPIEDRTYRRYRIYMDGEMVYQTPNNEVVTSWVIPQDLLTYHMDEPGYIFTVSAVYDEGESPVSNPVEIFVSGNGTVSGYVHEQDETTPIGGVTVTITGTNEFGETETYTYITDNDGYYHGNIHAGTYDEAVATMDGYQDAETTHELPLDIVYDEETDNVNFIMDELFLAPAHVCAQTTYVEGVEGDSLVQVWWDFNFCAGDYEAQIGNGSTTVGYCPFYTLYNYSIATALYKADEMAAAGVTTAPMTSLSWYATNTTGYNQQGITIWIANVTDNTVSTTSPLAGGMTKVYTGAVTPVVGWNEFVFNEGEFEWDGESNVLVLVQRNNGEWNSTVYWQGSNASGCMAYDYTDNAPYNVENQTYALYTSSTRPNIIMKGNCDRGGEDLTRSLHHYNIYRTDCYNDGPYNSDNTVFLASAWRPDTSYFDVQWPQVPVGVYKYGVSAVYAGNYDGNPNNPRVDYPFEPRESEIVWHNMCSPCIDKDMYLENEVTVNVVLNSADSPEGVQVSFENLNPGEQVNHPQAGVTLDQTGYYVFPRFRKGDYLVTVGLPGYETIQVTESIWEPRDLRYVLIEIICKVQNLYVSRTGWAMWDPQAPCPGGVEPGPTPGPGGDATSFTEGFEGGLNGWNVLTVNADGGSWIHSDNNLGGYDYTTHAHGGTGFAMCYSFVDYDGAYDTDSYLYTPQKYDIVNGSTLTFWADNANDSYPESFSVCVSTADTPTASSFTQVWSGAAKANGNAKANVRHDANRYDNWRSHSVDLSAYAGQSVYIAFHDVNYDMYEVWIDDVALTTGRAVAEERHLEGYKIMCTSIDGEPIFNHNTVAEQPFCQLATDQLVEGETYICKVAAIYSTGMSEYEEVAWQYGSCESYAGTVNGLAVEGSTVSWDYPGGVTPGPGPGQASTFTVGFEGGLPEGWTIIDANNDGNTWTATSAIPTTWTYYASLSLDWYHSGTDAMCSGSYINGIGAITPNDYLVSPQVTLAAGSQLSFWVAACDESYPADHFGVFVSTTGTNPSDFTSVQEWTLAGKSGGNGNADVRVRSTVGRDNRATRLGTWYNYTVDLSAYAGQAYIAFRHFNCNDQYIMCLDDVELGTGRNDRAPWDLMMTFNAPEAAHYGVAYDGENFYTSNWGYASAAHNFYKYDQQGNMLEGFEIAGCGTLRGMTTDGTYTYGVANANTVYCIDLAAHTLVGSFTTTYGAMRGITYDPVRDGFWVIGNWSGNLTLIDRTGAIQQTGPAPESASDLAYYKDENDVEHVFCFNNGTNDVQDWVIGSTTINSSVFNFSSTPGFDGGTSGGCTVASYNGKIAFIGDIQQSPNLIAVYELRDDNVGPTPPPTPAEGILGAMIFVDGEWEAFVEYPTNTYTYEGDGQEICVRMVYDGTAELPSNNLHYAMSCEECIGGLEPVCEPGAPIYGEVTADDQVRVYWSEPVPPIPGEGDTFEYDFENGNLDGLLLIDNDGDGYNWLANTSFGGHNGSTGIIYSQSYDNNFGALTPDNYIVFPQSNIANGSTFSFWACGQDASWASEHFGVAVSTEGTNASDFTTIAEWTMTAKGTKAVRDGRDQGNWYNYTVDLSDYAGMPVYIAIRHFNSTDMFYLDVDDVELGIANKGNRDGIIGYNIYRSEDNVDYALVGSVPGTATEYFDNPGEGTFYYQVTAVYANCESEPAVSGENPAVNYVMVGRTGIGENSIEVNLFPNPTKGNVTIQAMNMHRITVVSVLGQVVFDTELDQDEYILNMSKFNTGMYMVRVYTDEGVTVKRVTVLH